MTQRNPLLICNRFWTKQRLSIMEKTD